jgi:hypothetical protein
MSPAADSPGASHIESDAPTSPPVLAEAPDEGPAASEVEARSLLNRLFRDAGLRIVNDRALLGADLSVTLDGYDPEQGVGYEYIARQERDTDLSASESHSLRAAGNILILEAATLDELEEAASAFLAGMAKANPEP